MITYKRFLPMDKHYSKYLLLNLSRIILELFYICILASKSAGKKFLAERVYIHNYLLKISTDIPLSKVDQTIYN